MCTSLFVLLWLSERVCVLCAQHIYVCKQPPPSAAEDEGVALLRSR